MSIRLPRFFQKLFQPRLWAYGLFWSWNLIFLAFMLLGFGPQILPEMITAVRAGEFPAIFLAYATILTLIPLVAVGLGLTLLRRRPGRLFILGYGVEGPLMLLLAVRFFIIGEMNRLVLLIFIVAGLGIATLLWQLLDRAIDTRGRLLTHLRLAGLTLLLLTGLYAGLWLAFYAVPLAVQGGRFVVETVAAAPELVAALGSWFWDLTLTDLLWVPFFVLGFGLMFYTGTLFVLMPLAVPLIYGRAWWRGVRNLVDRYGPVPAGAITLAGLLLCGGLFAWLSPQPQQRAFALLETPPATPAEARALLAEEETIRAGLLNAYLAPHRYVSAVGELDHIGHMYEWTVGLARPQAEQVQALYEQVARPLLYQPVEQVKAERFQPRRWEDHPLQREPRLAAEQYEAFFDQPILEGEREAIVRAVRATWSIEQAATNWQLVADREVHLVRQEVTVTEHDDWADIELYEVYQNQTSQRQEVVYYFSLPELTVMTGVWLGNSPDREERFAYRVAPRGAAQATYRNEVRYNRDPALLEQVGPRQYRLRIFPIPEQDLRWSDEADRSYIQEGPPLHMWLTWRVLASEAGWSLPRLAEKRNIYWDDESIRLLNGEPLTLAEEAWLPATVPASNLPRPVAHRVDFSNGETVLIRPDSAPPPALPADLRLAVVLDRSRSMAPYADQVSTALSRLAELSQAGATIDLYLTASEYRGEAPRRLPLAELEPESLVYYGGQNAAELLVQFGAVADARPYQAILVLTDGSGYNLAETNLAVPVPEAPVWMVHVDGQFPLGYDDATLAAIQASGGGVVDSLEAGLARLAMALSQAQGAGQRSLDLVDGYRWQILPTDGVDSTQSAVVGHTGDDPFVAFGARWLILAEMQRHRGQLDQTETLDYLHDIAVQHSVVTPYSSMIVLVTTEQERLLDKLEQQGDRFQREHEDAGETVPENAPLVTGVPEPEEWLLLGVAAALLVWYGYTTRRVRRVV